jgi:asparagine synthase (glutamine-hydrolysing)
MCGILGLVDFKSEYSDKKTLIEATNLLISRGPDDSGTWLENGCGLGHRRLSILDLSPSGHQPMSSANDRYMIVFNGEIYNFQELKKQLSDLQINWKSNSDTEVLLEGWAHWGADLLDKIEGMFAFAIWDRLKRKLIIARDRMGEKPLYYCWNGKQFAFASRPRVLFKLIPNLSQEYDKQALRLYLESGYVPAPHSIHQSIKKLPAAHYLEVSEGVSESGLDIIPYWQFHKISTPPSWHNRSENDLVDELDEILTRSVKQRLISDVPFGAFLSGGIDSSLMVAMMSKLTNAPIKTFTIGFEEKNYDESIDAGNIASFLKTDHRCEQLKVNDLLDLFPTFLENYDEPFFDSSAFPTMAVSRLARKHVTVSISGDGGDELFGGYHYYKIAKYLNPFFSLPDVLRKSISSLVKLIPKHQFQLLSAALNETNSARAFAFSRSISKDFRSVISDDVIGSTNGLRSIFETRAKHFPKNIHASDQAMRLDALFTLNDDYLQKTDLACMSFSLESRAPFLSREVVEWAMKLPITWKIRGVGNKYLLRKLAYRYIPKKILDRPKRGFGVPIDSWLRGPLYKWASDLIENPANYVGLPLNRSAISDLLKLHLSGSRNAHPQLWAILMLLQFNNRLAK